MSWSIYVVRTRDGALYTGVTRDVGRRVTEHDSGTRGAKALRGRGPLELVYRAEVGERGLAQGLEHRLKRLSKREKEQIVRAAPGAGELCERFGLQPPQGSKRSPETTD